MKLREGNGHVGKARERMALAVSVAVILSALWFWAGQVGDVRETLALTSEQG